ncbi:MAG: hypothetical protein GC200_02700 [Tepidisphaera sp.]|nr:hypothetical protein [Tepidisphaera sp.]
MHGHVGGGGHFGGHHSTGGHHCGHHGHHGHHAHHSAGAASHHSHNQANITPFLFVPGSSGRAWSSRQRSGLGSKAASVFASLLFTLMMLGVLVAIITSFTGSP